MNIELIEELRKSPDYTLELSAETYEQLSGGLAGIRTVTTAITGMIPAHLSERLQACLAKSLGAIGMIEVVREDPEPTTEDRKLEAAERLYDERVQEGRTP